MPNTVALYDTLESFNALDLNALTEEEAQDIVRGIHATLRTEVRHHSLHGFEWSVRVKNWMHRNDIKIVNALYRPHLRIRGIGRLSISQILSVLTNLGLPVPAWTRK